MNIFKFEFKKSLKTTLIWSIAMIAFGLMYIVMGPVFIDQSAPVIAMLGNMDQAFLDGLGIDMNVFFTPIGFFSYIGSYIGVALAVQALMYGLKTFVTEKNGKSVEFLYTKPISRTKLFLEKNAASLALLTITQVIVITTLFISSDLINTVEYDNGLMLLIMCTYIPIQWMFYSVGILIGTSVNKLKSVVSTSVMIALGMYMLKMISDVVGSDTLGYFSFFKYFNMIDIITDGVNYPMAIAAVGIIVICCLVSYIVYIRKDMKVS